MEKTVLYSDKFIISENKNGFVFNFIKDKSDIENEIDYGFRIGMSSLSAKELLLVLFSVIGEYEQKNGEIIIKQNVVQKILKEKPNPIGFNTPKLN